MAQREGRWAIVDLLGKHGRVRTVPMPSWAKTALDGWASSRICTTLPAIASGLLARSDERAGNKLELR